MTMPSRFKLSPRSSRSCVAVAIRGLALRFYDWRFVVHLDLGGTAQGPDDFVSAGDNLIALTEPAQDFDVGGAGNSSGNFLKLRASVLDHENALQLFLLSFLGGWIGLGGGLDAFILADRLQIAALADSQSLNGNGERMLPGGGDDLAGAGERSEEHTSELQSLRH